MIPRYKGLPSEQYTICSRHVDKLVHRDRFLLKEDFFLLYYKYTGDSIYESTVIFILVRSGTIYGLLWDT